MLVPNEVSDDAASATMTYGSKGSEPLAAPPADVIKCPNIDSSKGKHSSNEKDGALTMRSNCKMCAEIAILT